jgi:phage shock protein A
MAEEVDLRFLGEQIKRVQGDVRLLKTDMAQMRADSAKVESELAALDAKFTRVENNLEAFRETVDDRFDQQVELIKSSFRTLMTEIQTLKKS